MKDSSYLGFAIINRRFVGFGFLMAFASSFGQTSFVGVFGPRIQAEFGLSHTVWGIVYMVGTLASAALLPLTGRFIDRIDLRRYAMLVCLLMISACVFTSLILNVVMLILAVFLLRHSGQGLMTHTATTSMARYFDRGRGRAIAIASLGFTIGEALLPFLATLVIALIGWRWTYAGAGILVGLGFGPMILWLLRGHAQRHRAHLERQHQSTEQLNAGQSSRTCAEVLRDPCFYLLLPGAMAPAMIVTALFFHHLNLADAKGWTHTWITGNYVLFAVAGVLMSLVAGRLIDRYGAVRLVQFMLIPLVCALAALVCCDSPWIVVLYMTLLGVNTGIASPSGSALWAELYGVEHLGSIKSMTAALGVFSSALGPVTMGVLLGRGVSFDGACTLFAGYCVLGTMMIVLALQKSRNAGGI